MPLAVLAVWILLADERYASLLRTEKDCISALMQKTGAEYELQRQTAL